MSRYGIPYMGSKSKICKNICGIFPKADNFYDLFGGGFSVTHFMMQNRGKDYKHFHFNEIRHGVNGLIRDAIQGKYSYENFRPAFVRRGEFLERIEEAYIKLVWSFGSSGSAYIYGKDIEAQKESLHNAVVFNVFDDFAAKVLGIKSFPSELGVDRRRSFLKSRARNAGGIEHLQHLEHLQRLERLQRLQRLEALEALERLSFYAESYEKVNLEDNSIIYCDIPYRGTADYDGNKKFSHEAFYDWAAGHELPVFVSEYTLPDSRFTCVFKVEKRSLLSPNKKNTLMKTECVFANRAGVKRLFSDRRKS